MDLSGSPMEIHIHLTDGSVHEFYQDKGELIAKILASIQPNKIFGQKQLVIAGSYFMAGFACDDITRVDILGDHVPEWPLPGDLRSVQEISEGELAKYANPKYTDPKRTEIATAPGELMNSYMEFEMRDRKHICMLIVSVSRGRIDQRQLAQNMTSGPGFQIRRMGGGGISIINPAHIARWAMYPGMPEAPANAWSMHRVTLPSGDKGPSMMSGMVEKL